MLVRGSQEPVLETCRPHSLRSALTWLMCSFPCLLQLVALVPSQQPATLLPRHSVPRTGEQVPHRWRALCGGADRRPLLPWRPGTRGGKRCDVAHLCPGVVFFCTRQGARCRRPGRGREICRAAQGVVGETECREAIANDCLALAAHVVLLLSVLPNLHQCGRHWWGAMNCYTCHLSPDCCRTWQYFCM